MDQLKAVIYARVSTRKQDTDTQIEILKGYAEYRNMEIVGVYHEKISGMKDTRPQLDKMLQELRNGKAKVILVTRLARLGRSQPHLTQLLLELNTIAVDIIATKQGIDTSTPMGRFFYNIIVAYSELEREMIAERTQEKMDRLRKKGVKLGRKSIRDPKTKEGKQRITRIKNLLDKDPDMSLRKLAKEIGCSKSTVYRIMKEDPELSQKGPPLK